MRLIPFSGCEPHFLYMTMTGDLLINDKDAWNVFGVNMGDGFIENILLPAGNKDYIENESRNEHGKRVLYTNAKLSDRDVTLTFNIHGSSRSDYLQKYNSFVEELQKGKVVINVPVLNKKFTLSYQKSTSFAIGTSMTNSKLSVKFNEPNPSERSV